MSSGVGLSEPNCCSPPRTGHSPPLRMQSDLRMKATWRCTSSVSPDSSPAPLVNRARICCAGARIWAHLSSRRARVSREPFLHGNEKQREGSETLNWNTIQEERTMKTPKTVIVTGASQGIGACLVKTFLERGYQVVATAHSMEKSGFQASKQLALVDGDIGEASTAKNVAAAAIEQFGGIDTLVNNAGIFFTKPFADYTTEDLRKLISTNLYGFVYLSQLAIKQMQKQKKGGSVVSITTSMVDHPIAGVTASVPMITKGGLDAVSRSLAIEYAREGIRVNTVAPGIVDTPLHKDDPKDFLKTLSPMGTISDPKEIASAVLFLTESPTVTGEVLHVDGGSHVGRW